MTTYRDNGELKQRILNELTQLEKTDPAAVAKILEELQVRNRAIDIAERPLPNLESWEELARGQGKGIPTRAQVRKIAAALALEEPLVQLLEDL